MGAVASIQVEEVKCGENKAGEESDSWGAIDSRGGGRVSICTKGIYHVMQKFEEFVFFFFFLSLVTLFS